MSRLRPARARLSGRGFAAAFFFAAARHPRPRLAPRAKTQNDALTSEHERAPDARWALAIAPEPARARRKCARSTRRPQVARSGEEERAAKPRRCGRGRNTRNEVPARGTNLPQSAGSDVVEDWSPAWACVASIRVMTPADQRRAARAAWPIARYRLGHEPAGAPCAIAVEERLAAVWRLTRELWAFSGRALPVYERSAMPGIVRRAPPRR